MSVLTCAMERGRRAIPMRLMADEERCTRAAPEGRQRGVEGGGGGPGRRGGGGFCPASARDEDAHDGDRDGSEPEVERDGLASGDATSEDSVPCCRCPCQLRPEYALPLPLAEEGHFASGGAITMPSLVVTLTVPILPVLTMPLASFAVAVLLVALILLAPLVARLPLPLVPLLMPACLRLVPPVKFSCDRAASSLITTSFRLAMSSAIPVRSAVSLAAVTHSQLECSAGRWHRALTVPCGGS